MKPTYAKSEKAYASASVFERKKILAAAKRLKKSRKLPTSVALEESTINELKALAVWRGVPYQVLMRMFILDGLHKSQTVVAR
jgi:predicted DNA binding CopG/RHH family protein